MRLFSFNSLIKSPDKNIFSTTANNLNSYNKDKKLEVNQKNRVENSENPSRMFLPFFPRHSPEVLLNKVSLRRFTVFLKRDCLKI